MKNQKLQDMLAKFNSLEQEPMNAEVEIITPENGNGIRGGLRGCTCKRNQTVVCIPSYSVAIG